MKKTLIIICIVTSIILLGISLISINNESKFEKIDFSNKVEVDVVMPTKVSRPGCEIEDTCYIPSTITISAGEEVSWQNQDSAFHSVTSGKYGSASELFDSGYMDPDEIFIVQFTESGVYNYHCTLHPWMEGKVIVK